MEIRMFESIRRPLQVIDRRVWVGVEFGLEPARVGERFVVSGRVWPLENSPEWESMGQVLPEIRMAFPELRPLLPWNNAVAGVPHRYIANAWFWYGRARADEPLPRHLRRLSDIDPTHAFAEAILLGALALDPTSTELLALEWPDCMTVLNERLPRLEQAFAVAMAEMPKIAERVR